MNRFLTRLPLVIGSAALLSLSACAHASRANRPHRTPSVENHRRAAEEYLDLLDRDALAEAYLRTYLQELGKDRDSLDEKEHEKLQTKMVAILKSEEVKRHLVELYLVRFTQEELEEIADFHQTKTGKKFLETAPVVMEASAHIASGALAAQVPREESAALQDPAAETPEDVGIHRPHRLDENGAPLAPADVATPPKSASCTSSGLCYRFLRKGSSDAPHPTPSSRVTVHYTGWSKDGTMFDSSVTRGRPATFGVSQVIQGWTEGLQLMTVGSAVRLWIPGNLAYGDTPRRPGAPTGQLTFDVHLIEMED